MKLYISETHAISQAAHHALWRSSSPTSNKLERAFTISGNIYCGRVCMWHIPHMWMYFIVYLSVCMCVYMYICVVQCICVCEWVCAACVDVLLFCGGRAAKYTRIQPVYCYRDSHNRAPHEINRARCRWRHKDASNARMTICVMGSGSFQKISGPVCYKLTESLSLSISFSRHPLYLSSSRSYPYLF